MDMDPNNANADNDVDEGTDEEDYYDPEDFEYIECLMCCIMSYKSYSHVGRDKDNREQQSKYSLCRVRV